MKAELNQTRRRNFRVWEFVNVITLWFAILLPWVKTDSSENINALVIALMSGFGLFELTPNSSNEEILITLLGFLFFAGIFCVVFYTTSKLVYEITEKRLSNPRLQSASLIAGFLPTIVITIYFLTFFKATIYLIL